MMRIATLMAFGLLVVAGCGDDDVGDEGDVVGGSCTTSDDCEVRCQQGENFPDGTCTLPCNVDDDCPGGSSCIDKEDGICLVTCAHPEDCRPGYTCKGEENRGHGGDSLVCIRD